MGLLPLRHPPVRSDTVPDAKPDDDANLAATMDAGQTGMRDGMNGVPQQALDLRYNSGGFLPDVGVYRHGDIFRQSLSRSHYWLCGSLGLAGIVVALLPWHTRAVVGPLKFWVAGIFWVAGVCDLLGSWLRSTFEPQIPIDPKNRIIAIVGDGFSRRIPWTQIIGLQICRQTVPGNSGMNGYQLNLVWREADGAVSRRCLHKHVIK
ncbi:MAG: hypothetical protein BWX84_01483 [Verrucomicrobia bacterium ADurb.Bin118]|jgi:hypothetical protein|nr:MAG: hypothetical protein BWX84_01483 [Verrucomicrobia bacterium ADurb.Bin118]